MMLRPREFDVLALLASEAGHAVTSFAQKLKTRCAVQKTTNCVNNVKR